MTRLLPIRTISQVFLLVCLLVLLFSGCASDGGFMSGDDYKRYATAHVNFATAESNRISAQSTAIASAAGSAVSTTAMESTLLAVIAMMQIERLQPQALNLAKPTTGYDVLGKLVDHVPIIAGISGMYGLGKIAVENAGQVTIGQGATVSDALNRPSVAALGDGNSVAYSGTTPAQVVEPTVIQVPQP